MSAEVVTLHKRREIPEWAIQKYERAAHLFFKAGQAFDHGDHRRDKNER